ncbi:3-deoxy-D-manno-octulosonate 8-phosphate phosphatase [Gallibacterium salpingitidis]|uniref:3-deoxy-D-manno-octulosonate 8-phosphate phosphatase KdsC n=1 Tax=Gallibacterium salpingitidis TaxID=505341 RepID=A0A1A7Q2P3_9PAST|nr:HAD-IIIA family hydrolase [Gallibacterium salpingitidis]OBW95219.1 3-deoxy-D-manno-octulosonate 8-phosphate phosphatase [Gallibacterium salpingitidis]OBX07680.1 3-deoxy-D-manno-octulosonate 8-phosphate phosphatase [Gallibacterium salpingitidis]OBX07969.1 3-deoxy-D-manno-octulosonate 8-phosphate phosphatase [Gallibacterium salpingitidis]WKT00768.1 HAD-IIIA family hydrolase [Gallibacterium salpingitidis]
MQEKLAKIKLVITDVDGVLTDGSLYYGENGEVFKVFNARDGLGTRMLLESGVQVAVLSGRDSLVLRKRIEELSIPLFQLGKLEKESACLSLIEQAGVTAEEVLYIGDDSVDLPAFAVCGLTATVAEAQDYIKDKVDIVTKANGGRGAFREIVDMILAAQGKSAIYTSATGFLHTAKKMAQ